MFAAIEAGGTKFVCAIGDETATLETVKIATRDPRTTLADINSFFRDAQSRHGQALALGIASFGPVDLDPSSSTYGHVLRTPKPDWAGFDILGSLRTMFGVPVGIDTDVNAAAMAEAAMGAALGCDPVVYVTVGTGIGMGIVARGQPIHGIGHPEGGHVRLRRHPDHGDFPGTCPFHGDCLEGLASGPAIIAAWGSGLSGLAADHVAWAVEADYIGQLCATISMMIAPQRIVLGGGVMGHEQLFPKVRTAAQYWLQGYIERLDDEAALARLIVPPGCVEPPGLAGAFMLARQALSQPS